MDFLIGFVVAVVLAAFFPEPLVKVKAWILAKFAKKTPA